MSAPTKYRATATITLPVVAVFDDDGIHHLEIQAETALQAEAQAFYCLADSNLSFQDFRLEHLAAQNATGSQS